MNETLLIKLLQLHYEHQRKIDEFKGKLNLTYLEIDLLDLVLDAIGVPADNSVEQIGQYGYGVWLEQSDTFSRGWYYTEFQQQVKHGAAEECRAYLENIIMVSTFSHLLNGGKLTMVQPIDADLLESLV
ncbi:MAG: hypothetical protein H6631_14800 [Anaerolineaceae bacterium]|nr:hypothetical protein [Anaerolineaceae bacterium]MCB9101875.1 hypothetical protein [Anaerolineales bacterium]